MELKLDYPIYGAETLTLNKKNYLLTVGGAGPDPKWGIKNTLELLQINSFNNKKSSDTPIVSSVAKYDKLTEQIMNVHYNNQMVALGEGSNCRFFRLVEKSNKNSGSGVKQRKNDNNKENEEKTLDFEDYGSIVSHKCQDQNLEPESVYQTCTEGYKNFLIPIFRLFTTFSSIFDLFFLYGSAELAAM